MGFGKNGEYEKEHLFELFHVKLYGWRWRFSAGCLGGMGVLSARVCVSVTG